MEQLEKRILQTDQLKKRFKAFAASRWSYPKYIDFEFQIYSKFHDDDFLNFKYFKFHNINFFYFKYVPNFSSIIIFMSRIKIFAFCE